MDKDKIRETVEDVLSGREEIVAVYLFGSFAKGTEHSQSDVDIGLILDKELDFSEESKLEAELSNKLGRKADLRILNNQDNRFVYNVLRKGELLFTQKQDKKHTFEQKVLRKYLDMKPFHEEYDRFVKQRLTS